MRRFVDSLIFLLVAYSLCWPFVREMVGVEPSLATISVAVRIPNVDVIPAATVRIARSEAEARDGVWIGEGAQRTGTAGVAVHATADLHTMWIAVAIPGADVDARPVTVSDVEKPVEIVLPADLRVVVGRGSPLQRRVNVVIGRGDGARAIEVPCDVHGSFVFALPASTEPAPTPITLVSERGRALDACEVPATGGVHDLGDIGE